jgi:hypothetical protein
MEARDSMVVDVRFSQLEWCFVRKLLNGRDPDSQSRPSFFAWLFAQVRVLTGTSSQKSFCPPIKVNVDVLTQMQCPVLLPESLFPPIKVNDDRSDTDAKKD